MLCPICLESSDQFENHHVIWKSDGGSDDSVNLLQICKSCHALLTFGGKKDSKPREYACIYYQLALYGVNFLLKATLWTKEERNWVGRYLKEIFKRGDDLSAMEVDKTLREIASERYIRHLAVVMRIIDSPDDDEFELCERWEPARAIGY